MTNNNDPVTSQREMLQEMATVIAAAMVNANAPSAEASRQRTALQTDYQATVDLIKLLTEIRFKCLTFVTAVIAIANALLGMGADPATRIALAAVGFITTLGITVYELRNSQLYEVATHRAKLIERLFDIEAGGRVAGGLFRDRPDYMSKTEWPKWRALSSEERKRRRQSNQVPLMRFLRVPVKHDRGLAWIYGGVLGGWAFLIARNALALPAPPGFPAASAWLIPLVAGGIGLLIFGLASTTIVRHDKDRFKGDGKA
jgi:hypothetical protein